MLALSTELRFPVLEQTLYLSMFGDAGNTWSGIEENINPTDLFPGAGFGVRLLVPMLGLMGFDFGYGFKKPGVIRTRFRPKQTDGNFISRWARGFDQDSPD